MFIYYDSKEKRKLDETRKEYKDEFLELD